MNGAVRVAVATMSGLGFLAQVGCEDSAARARRQTQVQIREASTKLESLGAAGLDPGAAEFAKAETDLRGIASELAAIAEGTDGQKASGNLLAASAQRELAGMLVVRIKQQEAAFHAARLELHGKLDAALRLMSAASGLQATESSAQQSQIEAELTRARTDLAAHSQRLAELDGPISELRRENQADEEAATALESQANDLRRQANERGAADGLEFFLQARALESDAERLRYRIDRRRIELDFELLPEFELAERRAQDAQTRIDALQASSNALQARDSEAGSTVSTMQQQVNDLRASIAGGLSTLQTGMNESSGSYDEAEGGYTKAAAAAGRTRSADGFREAAALAAARAHEGAAKLHWTRALGLRDHELLLRRIQDSGLDVGGAADALVAAAGAQKEAVTKAKASLQAAQEQVVQVRGNSAEIEAFRSSLDAAMQEIESTSAAPPMNLTLNPGAAPSGDDASTPRGASGQGFESPEALLSFLNQLPQTATSFADATDRLEAATHVTTEEGRNLLQLSRQVAERMKPLEDAIIESHGQRAANDFLLRQTRGARLNADRSAIISQGMQGESEKRLVEVDGLWYFDGDALTAEEQMMLASGDMTLQTIDAMVQQMVAGIRAGTFDPTNPSLGGFN